MKKHFILSCLALLIAFSSFGQPYITGTLHACRLDTALAVVAGTTSGGVWSSSNTIVATVGIPAGSLYTTVYAVWPGTATLTYTIGGSTLTTITATFTVDPSPTDFAGLTELCMGISSTYTDAIPGGTWSSSDPSVATIDSVTGYITGVSPGAPYITYTVPSGCSLTVGGLTITSTPTGAISGPSVVCTGSTATFANTVTTGTWSSSAPTVATIDSASGIVSAIAAGTAIITYTANGICGPASIYDTVSVTAIIPAPVLSGPASVAAGAGITLSASAGGGTWSSSNPAVATISSSGIVTGVSPGTATISYSVTTCTGLVTGATNVTVTLAHTGIKSVQPALLSAVVYPNPASHELNVVWNETTNETGNVTITDIAGTVVYKTTISMKEGTATSRLSLPALTNGAYILTIKSTNINYSDKIQILH